TPSSPPMAKYPWYMSGSHESFGQAVQELPGGGVGVLRLRLQPDRSVLNVGHVALAPVSASRVHHPIDVHLVASTTQAAHEPLRGSLALGEHAVGVQPAEKGHGHLRGHVPDLA